MVKGKFRYHFKGGRTMIDKNRYKTMKEAKAWARGHNKYIPKGFSKVVKVTTIKKPKKKRRKK